jgi:hypothetical protein
MKNGMDDDIYDELDSWALSLSVNSDRWHSEHVTLFAFSEYISFLLSNMISFCANVDEPRYTDVEMPSKMVFLKQIHHNSAYKENG